MHSSGFGELWVAFNSTFNTGLVSDEELTNIVKECFDFKPAAIIEKLDLKRPIYQSLSAYGHFGRSGDYKWEKTDMVDRLKEYKK